MLDTIKNRYLPIAKSLAILGLAALSVFLTVQLWLVSIPNYSFFPYLAARFTSAAPDGASDFVRPFRIVSGMGDGYFDIMYNGIGDSDFWEYGELVITTILQSGHFISHMETDMSHIVNQPLLIYQYAFNMDSTVFAEALGQRGATLTDVGIPNFTAVAVAPPQIPNSPIVAYFIREDYTWQFALVPTGRRLPEIFDGIDITPQHPYRRFAATDDALVFVPRFHENFEYHPVLTANPYENHPNSLSLAFIRRQVEHFFDNPATISHGMGTGGIFTFNNRNTSVRYLPTHILDYSSFRTMGRTPTNIISDFSAALAFINSDTNVTNEFFLAGYGGRGRGNVFLFDYVIENFPIVFAESRHTGPECNIPLQHAIEVTVERGRVVRYRKIAHTFHVDTSYTNRLMPAEAERCLGFVIWPGLRSNTHINLQAIETEQGG
ncbi:MAG: hypothetical protein FWC32_04280 [Firmicutes bacterium]|nr:hypothetical protein [Bacillota bacterium]